MKVTRRNFLAASAISAGLLGLAGCDGAATEAPAGGDDALAAPAADAYPIDPDGEGVEAKWSSEELRDGWTKVTQEGGAEIGVMDTAKIIQVGGYAFRDMNGNGKLDLWEDWRQSADDRAAALAAELPAEECVKLLWHGGPTSGSSNPGADVNNFDWIEGGSRAGVSRLQSDGESYATDVAWINQVQEMCESSEYGIPYINSTDPYSTLGIPSTVGLAPAMDKDVWRKAGMWISRAWRATGARLELGPQIDLYTQPTVKRLSGAESEDPALVRDFTRAFGGGMQSTWGDDEATDDKGWGDESVAIMLKHYVGAGAIETGCDDHNDQGKYDVFPGDNYKAHLIGFLDGGMHLDSATEQMAAVMPNYGIAWSEDEEYGELVGGGFNKKQISILRNAGWDGMITTDWGILGKGRGVEDLTEPERLKKMMDATVDQVGGDFYPDEVGMPAYDLLVGELGEDGALERVRESARRIFKVMANLDLFDQPYSDRSVAKAVFESEAAAAFAQEANDRCVIMLKNAGSVISEAGIGDKPKVYIPQRLSGGTVALGIDNDVAAQYFDVVTDAVGDPTGEPADEGGEAQYQESDITRADAAALADVQYAIVKVQNPQDAFGGFEGGELFFGGDTGIPLEWHPVSLQYRPYTADSDAVKQVSIAGDTLEDGTRENRGHYGKSTYATNESDLDLVISVKEALPEGAKLVLVVDADHPMVFSEIEPYADVILMGWEGIADSSFARVITGEVEPSGLLQFQMPANMDAVESQLEDVPRDMECYVDSEGNTYDFCFGLNWAGVIVDERTKTYKEAPLTQPETAVEATE